jgi:hypothetical protein
MTVEKEIKELEKMSAEELKSLFAHYFDYKPLGWSKDYLIGAIGYRMQEMVYGGLNYQTINRFVRMAAKNPMHQIERSVLPIGTCLIKRYKGVDYMVQILDEGFLYENKKYNSLSAVAKQICGHIVSGKIFFNLNLRRP